MVLTNKFLFSFCFFLLGFFAFSSSASASIWIPTNNECYPKEAINSSQTQICQFDNLGPREVHLKWQITPKGGSKQFCSLGCSRDDSQSCLNYLFRDSNGFGTSSLLGGRKIKTIDDIFINDFSLKPGNTYQVNCCEQKDECANGMMECLLDPCKPGTNTQSQKMKIDDISRCELDFLSTFKNLYEDKVTTITEIDAYNWSSSNSKDRVDFNCPFTSYTGAGSGDRSDLSKAVVCNQIDAINWFPNEMVESLSGSAGAFLSEIRLLVREGNIMQINIRGSIKNHPQISPSEDFGHALIIYGIKEVGDEITFDVVDSNEPHLNKLVCKKKVIMADGSSWEIVDCSNSKYYLGSAYVENFKIAPVHWRREGEDFFYLKYNYYLNSIRKDYCKENNRGQSLCKDTAIDRLLNGGILNFYTPLTIDNKGACFSWAMLVMRLVYLGDFTGVDYHPKDGKTVGRDCDIYHRPLEQKTSLINPSNWLGNVWLAWQNLLK